MNYYFYIDRKVTMWERDKYSVQATSEKEALKLIKKEFEDPTYQEIGELEKGVNFIETESLHDTINELDIKQLIYKDKIIKKSYK